MHVAANPFGIVVGVLAHRRCGDHVLVPAPRRELMPLTMSDRTIAVEHSAGSHSLAAGQRAR